MIHGFVGPEGGGGRTPLRRGVFFARRTPQAEGMTDSHTAQVDYPFLTPADSIRTARCRPLSPKRGQAASERSPRPAAPLRASPRKPGEPGERSRCAILAASSTRRVPSRRSYLSFPPPTTRRYLRSPFQSHCFFESLSISVSANFSLPRE